MCVLDGIENHPKPSEVNTPVVLNNSVLKIVAVILE